MTEHAERITGNRLYDLLEQTRKERIMLQMNILGTGHEGLTMIIDISDRTELDKFFIIDYPSGMELLMPVEKGKKCFFEFNGQDRIQYNFRSFITRVEKDCLILKFPDEIERKQRRRHFRISTPPGTTIRIAHADNLYEFDVIDLSEGGALINDRSLTHDGKALFKGSNLMKLQLFCREERLSARINIHSAEIIRTDKKPDRNRQEYAVKFKEISKTDEKLLREFVYNCQRKALKRRGYMED
jgi:c-di-GMP-binding flagellar brake protein YcgR